jgi:thermitase
MRLATVLVFVLAGAAGDLVASGPPNGAEAAYRDGVVLLGFHNGTSAVQQSGALAIAGAVEARRIGAGVHLLKVPPGRVLDSIRTLRSHPAVRYAEPDYVQTIDGGALPNDTGVAHQWAVQNTGQTVNGVTGTAGADERSLAAWGITTGANSVVVAVLDTGVQYTHPDLLTNIWNNPGGLNGCAAGTHGYNVLTGTCDPMDDDAVYGGHGTHVAGILGAVGNNAAGVAGVNWTTSIMAVKWVNGSTGNGFTSDLITAMNWVLAAKQAGVNVRVVNDSATWPGTAFSQALSDEIDLLGTNDILLACAAGNTAENNDTTPRYPCSYNRPNMICAGASDQNDNLWSSSNFGVTTVKLGAPGVNIYSTLRLSNYGYISGGSMASPQVAGTAALILSLGYQTVGNLRTMILQNVDPLTSLTGLVSTGGRLNVCKAVPGCASAATGTPVNSALPVVTGLPQYGSVLGASTGRWTGLPTAYSYQWYRCDSGGLNCSPITGATGQSYLLLASADAGATFGAAVTASNTAGSQAAQSGPSALAAAASSPFAINSTISDSAVLSGSVRWEATPSQSVNFVQFYIDGVLSQTVSTSPYVYNQGTTGLLDTTTLTNAAHVLGIRALAADNRTYGFYGATVTVTNLPGGGGGIALVQSNALEGAHVRTIAVPFGSANTAGNLIVAAVRMSSTSQTVTITDSTGSTYVDAVAQVQTADGHQVHLFYAKNVAGGANTVTATFSGNNSHPWLAVYEYKGLSTTSPLDRTAHAQGSGSTPTSGATATTVNPNELVFASVGLPASYRGTVAAGSGYALQQQDAGSSRSANETAVVTATGSYAGTFGLSAGTNWSAVVATFVAAGAPPPPPPPPPPPSPPTITTTALPGGTQGAAYTATVTATSGTTPYGWSIVSGTLPAGLTLGPNTGMISGTPSGSGTSTFDVQVKDANSLTDVKTLSIVIAPSGGGGPGIALVQSKAAEGSGLPSISVTFTSVNTTGNLIIAAVRMSSTSQTVTVTDSAGNIYTDAVAQAQTTDGHQVHVFYAKIVAGGGGNTVKATFSSTNNHPWLAVYEYSGLSALDRTAHAQGSDSAPTSGATPTTASANELVFAAVGLPASYTGTVAAGSGYALQLQDTGTSRSANEAAVVTSTGSYAGTFSLSAGANWSAVVATFKP